MLWPPQIDSTFPITPRPEKENKGQKTKKKCALKKKSNMLCNAVYLASWPSFVTSTMIVSMCPIANESNSITLLILRFTWAIFTLIFRGRVIRRVGAPCFDCCFFGFLAFRGFLACCGVLAFCNFNGVANRLRFCVNFRGHLADCVLKLRFADAPHFCFGF